MPYTETFAAEEPARDTVDALPGTTVVEFGAPWCPHCIGAQPMLRMLLDERADVRHLKIEDGRGKPLGRSYRVKLWPTVIVMRDGEEIVRVVRPKSDDDLAPVAEALAVGAG